MPFSPVGPLVEIGLAAPAALAKAGNTPPIKHWFKAIADTGCNHTSICSSLALTAGLPIIGKTQISSATETVEAYQYLGDLFFRCQVNGRNLEFPFSNRMLLELKIQHPNFDALLAHGHSWYRDVCLQWLVEDRHFLLVIS